MKKIYLMSTAAIVGVLLFAGINRKPALPYGFTNGTPEVKSITSLTPGSQFNQSAQFVGEIIVTVCPN